jgi:hypothetical protein
MASSMFFPTNSGGGAIWLFPLESGAPFQSTSIYPWGLNRKTHQSDVYSHITATVMRMNIRIPQSTLKNLGSHGSELLYLIAPLPGFILTTFPPSYDPVWHTESLLPVLLPQKTTSVGGLRSPYTRNDV